jgi:hypothetical protein
MLNSGEELDVKITEIGADNVKYKKIDFLEGPNYVLSNSDIFMIKFSNGDKKIFKNNEVKKENGIYSEIEEGRNVQLYTARSYSSKSLQVGSMIELRTKESVKDKNGYILIKANQLVYATVNEAQKAKGLGKAGSLSFLLKDIKSVDGQNIPAYLNMTDQGKDRSGTAIAVGALIFWPALFMKGKEAELKAGTLLQAYISEGRKIKIDPDYVPSNSNFQQPVFDVPKDCGPKPSNPNKFNSPNYNKNSQEYKFYKKRLQEWNDCNQ